MISFPDVLHAKTLVVDDEEANVLLLEQMLRGAGYVAIETTADPNKVCDLHRKNRYDLILLDLEMPGMDGFQVMEGLKGIERRGYLPVLAVTARPEHKVRALKAGARDFVSKPFDLAEVLIRIQNMLEVRLLQLETRKLYDRVVQEQKVSERLLHNVLPHAIAERLKGRPEVTADGFIGVIADSFSGVTVLFADIVGFTKLSEGISAEVLVRLLNDIFTRFDNIADNRGVETLKTTGDAYMAVAGAPLEVQDHAVRAADAALDMMEAMDHFNDERGYNLELRIGIHTGPAVGGVIGQRRFRYDLWGDTVNTAHRMESHSVPGRIQVTDSTRQSLNQPFMLEERGVINVKGKGEMHTWFLNGRIG